MKRWVPVFLSFPFFLSAAEQTQVVTRDVISIYWALGILLNILVLAVFGYFALRSRRNDRLKTDVLFAALPIHIGVVTKKGKILFLQTGSQNLDENRHLPEHLRDLPVEMVRELEPPIREIFVEREPIVREYSAFGTHRQIELQILPPEFFGEEAALWMSSDVTSLKDASSETERLAKRFRLILESIGDAVIVTDCNEKITQINPVALGIMQCTEKEALGKKPDEFFDLIEENAAPVSEEIPLLTQVLRTGVGRTLPKLSIRLKKDDTSCQVTANITPLIEEDGLISGALLFFRDVTEENKKRNLLDAQNAILKNAARMADIVYFKTDSDGNTIPFGNLDSFWKMHNGQPVPPARWMDPSYLAAFREARREFLRGETETLHFTYRSTKEFGGRYFEMRVVKAPKGPDNLPREMYGIIQDITTHHEAECRYRDNAALLQSIMDNLPGCIFVKDADREFRYILSNRSFENLLACDGGKIIGHTDAEFIHDPLLLEKIHYSDYTVLRENRLLETEFTISGPDGNAVSLRTLKTLLRQSDGHRLVLGMGIDITRQEQLEHERNEMIERLNGHVRGERILNQCLSGILAENDLFRAVTEMLHILGENAGADHCYIMKYEDRKPTRVSEWFARKASVYPQRPDSSEFCGEESWHQMLLVNQDLLLEDLTQLPPDLALPPGLAVSPLKSVYISAIRSGEELIGYIGMDFAAEKRIFSESDIHILHSGIKFYLLALERARRLDAIADSVALQRAIVENIAIPIAIFDQGGSIISANSGIAEICGEPSDLLIGKKYYEVLCDSSMPAPDCPIAATLVDRKSHSTEREMNQRQLILSSQPLMDRSHNMRNVLFYSIDITDQNLQKKQLQDAMELALNADRAKNHFIATMSHEIRTPLNVLVGFSELLLQEKISDEDRKRYLEQIRSASRNLLTLVNDVLDLSKLETNSLTLRRRAVNLPELLNEAVSMMPGGNPDSGTPTLQIPDRELLPELMLDRQKLLQLIINLAASMRKNAPDSEIVLEPMFTPAPDGLSGTLEILFRRIRSVKDADSNSQPDSANPGLEFMLVKRLTIHMEGKLESIGQNGSAYRLRLPDIPIAGTGTENAGTPDAAKNEHPDLRGDVILADDMAMNRTVLSSLFKQLQIPHRICASAEEVLVETEKQRPAAIFTDLWMPGMNGDELARMLKESPETAAISVIAITADVQLDPAVEDSFARILVKPLTLNTLRNCIEKEFPSLLAGKDDMK